MPAEVEVLFPHAEIDVVEFDEVEGRGVNAKLQKAEVPVVGLDAVNRLEPIAHRVDSVQQPRRAVRRRAHCAAGGQCNLAMVLTEK